MDILNIVVLSLAMVLSNALVLFGNYFYQRRFFREFEAQRIHDKKRGEGVQAIENKMKAYERLILFLERISPDHLVLRHIVQKESATELKHRLVKTIQDEYYHNITQQLYIRDDRWMELVHLKEEMIQLVERVYGSLNEDAKNTDLAKKILHEASQSTGQKLKLILGRLKADFGVSLD